MKPLFLLLLGTLLAYPQLSAQEVVLDRELIDPVLLIDLDREPEAFHSVIVVLRDQVDIPELTRQFDQLRSSRVQRVNGLISALKKRAEEAQPRIMPLILQSPDADLLSINNHWIVNAISLRARRDLIARLSQSEQVVLIEPQRQFTTHSAPSYEAPSWNPPNGREAGLTATKANKLWEMGYTGYGTRVLISDSGVDGTHPSLKTQFRFNNATANESYSSNRISDICDFHGTFVAGIVCGLDRQKRDTIGAAFNANWIGGPFSNLGNSETDGPCVYLGSTPSSFDLFEWAVDPDDNPNTVGDIPHAINASWGSPNPTLAFCSNSSYRQLFQAIDAAGIALIFSAGNEGQDTAISFPSAHTYDDLSPFSVGAVNGSIASFPIAGFSSRGPSVCNAFDGFVWKPQVVAPGVQVRSAIPGGFYDQVDGTSFAAPNVTGVFLLLREAFPEISHREILQALLVTARDLGDQGPDFTYGFGIIDALAAFNYLKDDRGFTPAAPADASRDIILVDAVPNVNNCDSKLNLGIRFENGGAEPLTRLDIEVRRENTNAFITSLTWEGNLPPGQQAFFQIPEFEAFGGNYFAKVTVRNPNGQEDSRPLNNTIKVSVSVNNNDKQPALDVSDAAVCSGGRVQLKANLSAGNDNGLIKWFDRISGGNQIGEGPVFVSEGLTRDTAFYAELNFSAKVGRGEFLTGNPAFLDAGAGLVFDCFAAFTLRSVLVFADGVGPRIVILRNSDDEVIAQKVVNLQNGQNRVNLGFLVEPGTNYSLELSVGKPLYATTQNGTVNYPFNVENVLSIKRATGTVVTYYPFFYDWEIDYVYPCQRSAAVVSVDDQSNAPQALFLVEGNGVYPLGNDGTVAVAFSDNSGPAASWLWDFGDGNTSTEQNPVHTYTAAGTYLVTLRVTDADGCSNIASGTIEVQGVTSTGEARALAQKINLFPNPVQSGEVRLDIRLENPRNISVTVTDLLGRQLAFREFGRRKDLQEQLSVRYLPAGAYLMVFDIDGVKVGKRLVVFE